MSNPEMPAPEMPAPEMPAPEFEETPDRTSRFSLQTLLLCMVAWVLLLAYAKATDRHGPIHASIFLGLGLSFGFVSGLVAGKISERLYWGSLISILAFLAVAGGGLKDHGIFYGWGVVGAIWGALFPSDRPQIWLARSLLFAAVGGFGMLETCIVINRFVTNEGWFDICVATIIGAMLGPASRTAFLLQGSDKKQKILMVLCLVASVLAGNWLVPYFGGGTR